MMQADEDVKSPYKPDFSISETLIPVFAINSSYITPVKVNSNNVSWTEEEYDGSFIASSFEPSPNPQERQLARTRSTSKHRQKELILKEPFDDSLLFPIELVPKILCVGASCVDIILAMDEYPTEDKKHRCNESVICGGGNASNTAVAISRLGFPVCLMSKRGSDTFGQEMIRQLLKEEINVDFVTSSKDTPTAMTHVIINSENCSRTCIHAPLRQEITQRELADHLSKLSDFSHYGWIHFDSRHTEAALEVAKRAKRDGCFMSIDAEKDRPPHMRELLSRCDIVFMSKDFAESILPSSTGKLYQLMMIIFQDVCPKARLVVATDGKNGSFLLRRPGDTLGDIRSRNARNVVIEEEMSNYVYKSRANRDIGDESSYLKLPLKVEKTMIMREGREVELLRCSAMSLRRGIVDSTGAGDAYIGGFLAGLLNNFELETCMALGTLVATRKLGFVGARAGLPSAANIRDILGSLVATT